MGPPLKCVFDTPLLSFGTVLHPAIMQEKYCPSEPSPVLTGCFKPGEVFTQNMLDNGLCDMYLFFVCRVSPHSPPHPSALSVTSKQWSLSDSLASTLAFSTPVIFDFSSPLEILSSWSTPTQCLLNRQFYCYLRIRMTL
ncbi:hypothetical protein QCA50_013124 [Cerrena zonata]|uniref:Uncharacterized protein n=1 Tax=Cerrena zonata TaxID=2478898 RepID=A0AAW0G1F4_9APHY